MHFMHLRWGVWLLILTLVFEQTSKITCFVSTPSIFLCFQTYNKQPRNETKKWLVTTANNLLSLTLLLPCWDALNSNQRFPLPPFFKVTNITSSFLRSSLQHKTQKRWCFPRFSKMPFFYNSIFKTILLKWFNGVNILDPSDMKNLFTIFFSSVWWD